MVQPQEHFPRSASASISCSFHIPLLLVAKGVYATRLPGMVGLPKTLVITLVLVYLGSQVESDASDHRYGDGDAVPFYANKVGPFHNPRETYAYFHLPFCSPDTVKEKKLTLGEMLNGDRLVSTPYKLEFLVNKDSEVLCNKTLSKTDVSRFRSVIAKDYYMQLYYDDLPIWAFIGMVQRDYSDEQKNKYFLFKHFDFEVLYNKDRVIEVKLRMDQHSLADVTEDKEVDVDFTYSVKWLVTQNSFENRMEKYKGSSILPHHMSIHHHSIANSSVVLLILSICLITFYVLVLRKDISKYSDDVEGDQVAENLEETGWKNIHGDVFRFPRHKSLFSAALGSGTHLLLLIISILGMGLLGVFQPYLRGVFWNALVIAYAVTSVVSGYTSVSFYCQLEGTSWMKNLLLTGGLYFGPLFLTFCFLNSVAIFYGTTAALPIGAIAMLSLLWMFLASPSLLLGWIVGKNRASNFGAPCRTSKCPREIPQQRWYRGVLPQMALAGVLPFSAVYIQLYYIFATVWGHRIYTLYSIMSVVFFLVLVITALVSVALTYFQLAVEDHEWWWRSFFYGGSTGLYMYAYCIYFYFMRSDMTGFMQTSFFFGYMACVCYGIFLVLGSVGFRASLLFVRYLLSGMVRLVKTILISLLLVYLGSQVESDASDHRYRVGDAVPFYANIVGPYHNPRETYAYFHLPFCSPDIVKEKKLTLGEMLNGDRLVSTPYKLEFLVNKDSEVLCNKTLSKTDVSMFRSVIAKDYYMQLYYDDLPIWAFIGMVQRDYSDEQKNKYFLFKHFDFEVLYNKDRVIEVILRVHSLADVTEDKEVDVDFTYSVKWLVTQNSYENRMEKYKDSSILPHHMSIHRHSIANSSVVLLILSICLITFYVLVLRKDISKYSDDVEVDQVADNLEETGWKNIHGDVFRFPRHKSLFAAALGSGTHLLLLIISILGMGLLGVFQPYLRGVFWNALVITYAVTSVVSGYTSVSFYCQLEGTGWMKNLLLTGGLYLGPLFLTFCFLNSVAIFYGTTAALPIEAIVMLSLLWIFLASPLLLLGGIVGKNRSSNFEAPCRTSQCPREIPQQRWYRGVVPQMALAGVLPFSAVYIQLYYIFATVWGHRIYTLYSIMSVVFFLVLVITALVSVALTYFQLAVEDHEWWWRNLPLCSLRKSVSQSQSQKSKSSPTSIRALVRSNYYTGMVGSPKPLFITLVLVYLGSQVESDAFDHRYSEGDTVPFYASKVAPFYNPWETYAYYDLPFCSPDNVKEKKFNLREMLNGDRLVLTPYTFEFLVNKTSQVLCKKRLSKTDVSQFASVVAKHCYMKFYYDDLPMSAFIGMVEINYSDEGKRKYFLFKHLGFEVLYNKDRVIEVNLRREPDSLVDLTEDKEVDVDFTYSVEWLVTQQSFEERMEKYIGSSSLIPEYMRIHHHSIAYSSVMLLILIICLLTFYVLVIHKDISKYSDDVEGDQVADHLEEIGWKNIHDDVFRFPRQKSLFAAALGSGTHLLLLIVSILVMGLLGVFQPYLRGLFWSTLVIAYAVTHGVLGYTSASFYCQLEGTSWMKNLMLTGGLYFGPLFLTFCFQNGRSIFYGTTAALPIGAILILSLLWIFLALPLLLLGGIVGKKRASDFDAPCRTAKCPREVPRQRWYRGVVPQMALAGILPFSAVYVQLPHILATVLGHRVYPLYSILSGDFFLVLVITALVSVALTYFQLAVGDHEWWWRSFFCGGSTALFIYGYCIDYYIARSDMTGVMPASLFFGYTACVCYGIFLVLGSVGFRASLLFVRYLYAAAKCD
ncbi:hypothetical protein OSB04_018391 [Centaurea solstitialis]|uniref:Transmembrane 9 superfamily member n=1 Tax=Centaurea solstitialis TaxID=347529 RepID=A0AA38WMY1_9ASTR|nr:hypothetical protein OSB04_018391 [Centaurea solstitialis]